MAKPKPKPIHETYKRCETVRHHLFERGHPINVTEQKTGHLVELWSLHCGRTLVLFASPHGWDVYTPLYTANDTEGAMAAIDHYTKS